MPVQTYAVYTRCSQCGVYDRDPGWCTLCGRPKEGRAAPECQAPAPDGPAIGSRKRSMREETGVRTAR
ncbi:MAG TPA: hypothetical protein VN893_19195 [Bryobacteraceae bacterium]|nr:hypothetical protein [Bryobacteraceae bacterium]